MGFLGLEKFYKMIVESLFLCVCDFITMTNLGFHERERVVVFVFVFCV